MQQDSTKAVIERSATSYNKIVSEMSPKLENLQKTLLKNGTAIGWLDSAGAANVKHYN